MTTVDETRVERFVRLFRERDNEMLTELADVYQHYLDNTDAINNGEFDIDSIPHFSESAKPVIHGGVMFGITWGKESELSVVTKNNGEYVSVYGSREVAEHDVDLETHSIQQVIPDGQSVENDFSLLQSSETEMLRELGEAIEYLYNEYADKTRDDVMELDNEDVVDEVPHLDSVTGTVLLYSMLFGRQWELSEPGLWVVTENEKFDSLHGSVQSASEQELEGPEYTVEAITPIDNDRQSKESPLGE